MFETQTGVEAVMGERRRHAMSLAIPVSKHCRCHSPCLTCTPFQLPCQTDFLPLAPPQTAPAEDSLPFAGRSRPRNGPGLSGFVGIFFGEKRLVIGEWKMQEVNWQS